MKIISWLGIASLPFLAFSIARADIPLPAAPQKLRIATNEDSRAPIVLDDNFTVFAGNQLVISSPGVYPSRFKFPFLAFC